MQPYGLNIGYGKSCTRKNPPIGIKRYRRVLAFPPAAKLYRALAAGKEGT
jgi:hypothetical protein